MAIAQTSGTPADAINRYMSTQTHLLPKVSRRKRLIIATFVDSLGDRSLASATAADVEAWLDRWPLSAHTRRHRRGMVTAFFTWAVESQIVSLHPVPPVRRSGRCSWSRIAAAPPLPHEGDQSSLEALALTYVSFRLRRGDMTPVTAANTLVTLNRFADRYGRRSLDDLAPEHIEEWLQSMGHLALNTRRTELARLKPFLRWLARRGYVPWDPGSEIGPIKVPRRLPRHLPRSDVVALLAACPDSRTRLIVLCQVQLGLRCCEVGSLRLIDVCFADRTVRVRGKGGHERLLPIDDETWCALGEYLRERRGGPGPLIRSRSRNADADAHLSATRISQVVRDCMYAARIKHHGGDGVSAHILRHTACVDMLRRGAHVRDVQTAMGHAKIETTAWYLPMVIHGLRQAMGGRWYGLPPTEVGRDRTGTEALQLSLPGLPLCQPGVGSPIPHLDPDGRSAGALDAEAAARSIPRVGAFGRAG